MPHRENTEQYNEKTENKNQQTAKNFAVKPAFAKQLQHKGKC